MSVTYIPSLDSTFAVMYGCNELHIQAIEKRIRLAWDKTKYPLLVIGIIAELERERLVDAADQLLDKFALKSEHIENESWNLHTDMSNAKTQEYLALCLQSRSLVDNIKSVRRQVLKLQAEIDEFESRFRAYTRGKGPDEKDKARQFKEAGIHMKKRLQDIINEYDDKADECKMIVGNTSLAMQTVSRLSFC